MSIEKSQVPNLHKNWIFSQCVDCSVTLDFGHVLWVYKVAFEPKRYLTIPSGNFVETFLNRGTHCEPVGEHGILN